MTTYYYFVLYVVSVLLLLHQSKQNIVTTAQGKIRGIQRNGYVSYVGVPYASINGNGRFKKAGIAPRWQGIKESRDPYCTARSDVQDCLQLDIHVPTAGKTWPILVWVRGSNAEYSPVQLVKEGIIVVSVRHRLGIIGFACSKEETIPGNAGIKDIVLALRWIRDNIIAFQGNPHRIVVAGQGFGAATVEALTLSSMARGLYHGIILQSGSILAPWAFNYDAYDKTNFMLMMFNGTDSSVLVKSLIEDIVSRSEELNVPYFPFGICVEKAFKNEEILISEAPYNSLMKQKLYSVPILIGYNTNEAYIFYSLLRDTKVMKRMTTDTTFLLPMELQSLSDREINNINTQVKALYFKNNMNMSALIEYHRDVYFLSHIHRSAKLHANNGIVFYYQFSHTSKVGIESERGLEKKGPAHSDELAYLFPNNDLTFEEDDIVVQQHFVKLWTNFVKTLNPTTENIGFEWTPLQTDQHRVLDIKTTPEMIDFPYKRQIDTWEQIYDKFYFRRH